MMSLQRLLLLLLASSTLLYTHSAAARPDHGLPPGLHKKAAKGQSLPPGWQKKLRRGAILDRDIYSHGYIVSPRDRDGLLTIRVEGTLLRVHEKTRKILDIIRS